MMRSVSPLWTSPKSGRPGRGQAYEAPGESVDGSFAGGRGAMDWCYPGEECCSHRRRRTRWKVGVGVDEENSTVGTSNSSSGGMCTGVGA